jgi:predicted enzyme related to lactoylglutathione lyase
VDPIGRVDAVVIDGADTVLLAEFWAALFGTDVGINANDGHYIDVEGNASTPMLRFQRVPEAKRVKNRLHLDIEVDDLGAATARVRALGGRVMHPMRTEYGWDYIVMGDPEDNEFCLIRRSE